MMPKITVTWIQPLFFVALLAIFPMHTAEVQCPGVQQLLKEKGCGVCGVNQFYDNLICNSCPIGHCNPGGFTFTTCSPCNVSDDIVAHDFSTSRATVHPLLTTDAPGLLTRIMTTYEVRYSKGMETTYIPQYDDPLTAIPTVEPDEKGAHIGIIIGCSCFVGVVLLGLILYLCSSKRDQVCKW
uniref:Tyrosine-protein kinase ephrin type A/B receptor-like domain-containing protein n=1 Tax=Ciona savignyi TaxID=51511 RepID=H2ZMA5_CIOSA